MLAPPTAVRYHAQRRRSTIVPNNIEGIIASKQKPHRYRLRPIGRLSQNFRQPPTHARARAVERKEHPTIGKTDVHSETLRGFDFRPAVHLNYQEHVLPIRDGLPKLRDLPPEIGGSGEMMAE